MMAIITILITSGLYRVCLHAKSKHSAQMISFNPSRTLLQKTFFFILIVLRRNLAVVEGAGDS